MASKSFGNLLGGSWETGANWNPSGVPAVSDDALIALAGTYTVTIGAVEAPNSVTLNAATATLSIGTGGELLGSPLTINAGTLALTGIILGSTVINSGVFTPAGGTLDGVTWQGTFGGPGSSYQSVNIKDGITLLNLAGTAPGTLIVGSLYMVNVLDSTPLANMTIDFTAYNNEYLSGPAAAAMVFDTTSLVTQTGSAAAAFISGATLISNGTIDATSASGSLYIEDAKFNNTGALLISGGDDVIVQSGFTNTGSVSIGVNGKLSLTTTSNTVLSNANTISVSTSGSLVIGGSLAGNGTITMANFAVVDMYATTNTLSFLDAKDTLRLEAPKAFTGNVLGFEAGDKIDLLATTVTKLNYAGGTGNGVLTVLNGTSTVATLNLIGNYTTSTFGFASDGVTGENITITGTANPPRTLNWTGASGTAFGTAANWDDLTKGLNPATTAPATTDTVEFNSSGGGISGTGSVANIIVGSVGNGVMDISAGATIVSGSLDAGVIAAASAQIGVTGAGTDLSITGGATVADDGAGVLSVLNGATFSATNLTIGSQTDSSGALVVSGTGSVLQISGSLNIGTALGTGDLTVGPGAVVNASVVNLQGGVVLEGGLLDPTVFIENGGSTTGGFGTVSSQFILLEGTILSNGSKSGKETEVVQGTVVGGGTATINGTVSVNGPGILQIGTHDTIELTSAVLNAATTTFTDNLTPTGTYTVNNSVIDVVFQDTTGVLQLDDIAQFAGTVATWKAGDQFVITGGTLSGLNVSNGDTLTVQDSGAGAGAGGIDSIIFGAAISTGSFSVVNGNTVEALACFVAGTWIETDRGPVAVEDLKVGDFAVTVEGAREPIVWIGRRTVNCRTHPMPDAVFPVRVAAGALGPARPSRDLWLSPEHAVFVNGVLVPVHLLTNGKTIAREERERVTYFHVELPRHAIILAEDLPVESYLDTGDRANFRNGGLVTRLFADFSAPARDTAMLWETEACAALVMHGPELEAARAIVLARATGGDDRPGEAFPGNAERVSPPGLVERYAGSRWDCRIAATTRQSSSASTK